MNHWPTDPGMGRQIRKSFSTTGALLILIGIIAILLPQAISIVLSVFIGSLLILSGLVAGFGAWTGYRNNGLAWLKPFALIVIGLLIAFNPAAVAAALGLLLVIYFLQYGSINRARSFKLPLDASN